MAKRTHSKALALQRDCVVVAGSFAPNGTSAVSATSRTGPGWSVSRTDVGKFTITFTDKYKNLLSATATLQLATAAASVMQVGTYTAASRTLVLQVLTESTGALVAADIAANANNRIHFVAVFSNTGAPPVRG